MVNKYIRVYGARENNLKNIDVTIPRDKMVVFTGLSGSGKSSLAFDTIYAEGHRRFVESLSSYARMFLGQLDKPDVDRIEGLSPAISIDQKTTSKNPRSTVGTVTEIYDYLRLLYARCGTPHCPICGKEIVKRTIDSILDEIMELPEGTKFYVLAPLVKQKKGTHAKLLADLLKSGYVRVRVDGGIYNLTDNFDLDKNLRHDRCGGGPPCHEERYPHPSFRFGGKRLQGGRRPCCHRAARRRDRRQKRAAVFTEFCLHRAWGKSRRA